MYYTLYKAYRGPFEPNKKKDTSKRSKASMLENEEAQFILYHYNITG